MKRKTARGQRSPANIRNGWKNFRRQPPAETELRKWNGNLCSNGLKRKKWNTWEGRPFVPYNFRSNRALHLHLNRLNRTSLTWGDFSRPVSPRRENIFLYVEGLRVEVMPLSLMRRYLTNQLSWRVVKGTYYHVSATLIATSSPGFFIPWEQGCTGRPFSRYVTSDTLVSLTTNG